jgi:hypothetical protein
MIQELINDKLWLINCFRSLLQGNLHRYLCACKRTTSAGACERQSSLCKTLQLYYSNIQYTALYKRSIHEHPLILIIHKKSCCWMLLKVHTSLRGSATLNWNNKRCIEYRDRSPTLRLRRSARNEGSVTKHTMKVPFSQTYPLWSSAADCSESERLPTSFICSSCSLTGRWYKKHEVCKSIQ